MDIYLNKDVIENLNLNNYDIATYVALRSLYFSENEEFYISTRMLVYKLYGCNIPERALKHIKESISHLADFGLFDIISILNGSSGEYIIKDKQLYLQTYDFETGKGSYFSVISTDEVRQIMLLPIKKDKFALLRFFINVIGTFNRSQGVYDGFGAIQNFVGYMSQDYIGDLSGINRGVVADYFKILEDEKLLYVYRHDKATNNMEGKLKSISNHYGRYRDKEDIKQFALQYEKTVFGVNMEQSNQKRSLMAKYNHIVSDPEKNLGKYSRDELVDIYEYVSDRNKRQKELNLDDIKDLSVFDSVVCGDRNGGDDG